MHVIAIATQKGGTGKSTLTAHLATAGHYRGYATAIIDADTQGSLRFWDMRRQKVPNLASVTVMPEATADFLADRIERLKASGADLVYIDTPGRSEPIQHVAMELADLTPIPCRASITDTDAVPPTANFLRDRKKVYSVVLNDIDAVGGAQEEKAVITGFGARGIVTGAPSLRHRKVFRTCMIEGRTASEVDPSGKAAAEIEALHAWICQTLGINLLGPYA